MDGQPPNPQEVPKPLSRNLISYVGWVFTCVIFVIMVILIGADLLFHSEDPYNSLITYLVLPGLLAGGVGLILFGVLLEWRRRHKLAPGEYPPLPVVNLNINWQRKRLTIGLVLASVFFALSALGMYHGYHFTESPEFCGLICHQVMKPEYTAYQHSPHARVACTECHIGSGADWYVKAKMSGLRQVWAVATNSYHLPINTPVHNLRPAQGTCEQCHWPEKFSDSVEKVIWHFAPDQSNTAMRTNMLMKIGGGASGVGAGHGSHWHINNAVEVRYWSRDEDRLDIPWVEVKVDGEETQVYRSEDCPDPLPADAQIRRMDCIDCHNRPSHVYRSPHQLLDFSLANGILDPALPFIKRNALALLEQPYPSTPAALAAMDKELKQQYSGWAKGKKGQELIDSTGEWIKTIFQRNFFPEQKVDWRQYPNHLGHFEFPGCVRCHDDRHRSAAGKVIRNDCNLCHEIVDQAEGDAAFEPAKYQAGDFQHPRNLGEIWKGHFCTDCHGSVAPAPAEHKKDIAQN